MSIATQDNTSTSIKSPVFKVGWDLATFCRRNELSLDEGSRNQWLAASRQASKDQLERMHKASIAGFKTTVKQAAVWNLKAKCWDTAETARVVIPDCKDPELIQAAYVKAQARAAKDLAEKRAAAIDQGANID